MKIKAKETFTSIRVHKGYSINGLARVMEVHPSVVWSIEKGNGLRPTTAKKACLVLGKEFDELFIIENDLNS